MHIKENKSYIPTRILTEFLSYFSSLEINFALLTSLQNTQMAQRKITQILFISNAMNGKY